MADKYTAAEMPVGEMYVEVSEMKCISEEQIRLTRNKNKGDRFKTIKECLESLEKNAKFIKTSLESLSADETELSIGLKLATEGGSNFWLIAKASAEANLTIKFNWKNEDTRP
jgi:hypothetical protein